MQPFPRYAHHICLVSDQTLPNYLGATEPGAAPQKVHLIVSEAKKERAVILENALKERKIEVASYPIRGILARDVIPVLEKIYRETGSETAINVTCGTKIMALTAVEWAASLPEPKPFIFYVDTDNRQFLHIGKSGDFSEIRRRLRLGELLKAHAGAEITSQKTFSPRTADQNDFRRLLKAFLEDPDFLTLFNKANKDAAVLRALRARIEKSERPQAFEKAFEIAKVSGNIGSLFESYVMGIVSNLRSMKHIDDFSGNIVISENKIPKYELDAAFTANNKLFIIECKTEYLQQKKQSYIINYKSEHNRNILGGSLSKSLILTILEPNDTFRDRCEDMGIKIIFGKKLLKLEEHLLDWIRNSSR